jgi:hypothetical protein
MCLPQWHVLLEMDQSQIQSMLLLVHIINLDDERTDLAGEHTKHFLHAIESLDRILHGWHGCLPKPVLEIGCMVGEPDKTDTKLSCVQG